MHPVAAHFDPAIPVPGSWTHTAHLGAGEVPVAARHNFHDLRASSNLSCSHQSAAPRIHSSSAIHKILVLPIHVDARNPSLAEQLIADLIAFS